MMVSDKKTAIYIRLSMEDDNVDGCSKYESDSVSSQRILLRTFAMNDLGISDSDIVEYVDDGVSGTHFNRLGFQKLQEDMKSGLIGCVIVKDFSRFGRDYLEVGFFIEYIFPLLQIRFISINDGYDSQASSGMTGGMNVALKNLINNMYSLDLSKKITSALRTRQRNGTQKPVSAKYGYKKGKDGHLVIDPEAALVVKKIFELAAKGVSFAEITRILNEEKVLTIEEYVELKGKSVNFQRFDTIKKKMWSASTVSSIIRDEIYLGVRIWGRTRCSMHTGHKSILNDKEDWIRIENAHEALIDRELFELANRLHPRKKRTGISESRKNHTIPRKAKQSGFLICGNCGHALLEETAHILKCNVGRTSGDKICREFSVRREELETAIMEYVRKYAASMLADKKSKRAQKRKTDTGSKTDILSDMKHFSSEKMKLYDEYKNGYISKEDYKELAETITQKLTKLQEQLDSIAETENEVREADQDEYEEWKELSALQTFDKEKLRQVIRVIRVYSQNEIEIEWKCDDGFRKSNP